MLFEPIILGNPIVLKEIDLSCNKLERISTYTFEGLTLLTFINLKNNSITAIDDYAFQDAKDLLFLLLQENEIKHIGARTFVGLSRLLALVLRSNALTSIENNAFSDLQTLTTLLLHSNKLTLIEKDTFTGLKDLEDLNISNNSITRILACSASKSKVPSLRFLNLKENPIKYIGPNSFSNSTRVEITLGEVFFCCARIHYQNKPYFTTKNCTYKNKIEDFYSFDKTRCEKADLALNHNTRKQGKLGDHRVGNGSSDL
ncbi:slit homolog 2 protein-like [Zophobas morio]|uniref:slit homolog 2 protein-like n=1 Tax=Zophobas morio TaxID=2755281 RepID=UPI003083823D